MHTMETNNKPQAPVVYDAQFIVNKLAKANVPAKQIPLLLAQIATETGNFKDRKLYEYNNAGGLVYSKSFYDAKDGITAGRPLPEAPKYNYAIFPSFDLYLKYYLRILRRKPFEPIKAIDAADFVKRLKEQNYFTGSADQYLNNVRFWLKKYGDIKPAPIATTLLIIAFALLIFQK